VSDFVLCFSSGDDDEHLVLTCDNKTTNDDVTGGFDMDGTLVIPDSFDSRDMFPDVDEICAPKEGMASTPVKRAAGISGLLGGSILSGGEDDVNNSITGDTTESSVFGGPIRHPTVALKRKKQRKTKAVLSANKGYNIRDYFSGESLRLHDELMK